MPPRYRLKPASLTIRKKEGVAFSRSNSDDSCRILFDAMGKHENHGFDVTATRARLEAWCLEHFAHPYGGNVGSGAPGQSIAIRALLVDHWGKHGFHPVIDAARTLESAFSCTEDPCRVLGVALAVTEIDAYNAGAAEQEEINWLQQAKHRFSISESIRSELLALGDQLAASPVSRAVANQTSGRPKRILAQAVAQHLWRGGFSYGHIAAFMGATADATRRRCKVPRVLSLGCVLGPRAASRAVAQ